MKPATAATILALLLLAWLVCWAFGNRPFPIWWIFGTAMMAYGATRLLRWWARRSIRRQTERELRQTRRGLDNGLLHLVRRSPVNGADRHPPRG